MRNFNLLLQLTLTGAVIVGVSVVHAQTPMTSSSPASTAVLSLGDQVGALEYPRGWSEHRSANLRQLWNVTPQRLANMNPEERETIARIETIVIHCADHAEAVQRLREIEAEWGMTSTFTTIAGWPALQRRQLVPRPRVSVRTKVEMDATDRLVMVTTAVAADATLIRLDGFAPETASPEVLDQMESIGLRLRPHAPGDPHAADREAQRLRNSPSLRGAPATTSVPPRAIAQSISGQPANAGASNITPGSAINLGAAFLDLDFGSESEIAVSPNGTNIVVGRQCQFRTSTNGGFTFPFNGFAPGNCTGGDASVAFGQSGNFYYATIGSNTATCPPPTPPATVNNCNNIQQIARSTNNGQTFANLATVIDCRVTAGCGFGNIPDQEHIAADRVNASSTGGDQVYLAFRKGFGYGIQCSRDSGANWTAVAYHTGGSIDFPRITVSQNGTVFVVTNNGNNINLDSFSSCQNGLVQNLNQVAIATGVNAVTCPVPGLDRCNDGNTLRSHTVAVDDTNANHLYAAYATTTVSPSPVPPGNAPTPLTTLGNENVMVRDSTNGGANWGAAVRVSSSSNGRRYEPWVCATGGTAFVSWLDRRTATTTSNDLTDYFSSSAFLSGGVLTPGADFRINGAADPQCASGWPCLTRSANDSESCSTQPQLAGTCRHSPNNNSDSNMSCDFSGTDATVCPMGETCQGGGGCPKYGDYTGNACVLGRLYNVWPSGTNQPPAVATGIPITSFFVETVVGSTATTLTYIGATTGDYHDDVNLAAVLVLQGTSVPVVGQNISFTLGSQNCGPVATNASGVASCTLNLNQTPNAGGGGPYSVVASFAGSGNFQASIAPAVPFTITKEETTTTYTGPTLIINGTATSFSAVLKEDGVTPIAGRTIKITLGAGPTAQTCTTGVTDAAGRASCTITPNQLVATAITANFLGDNFYLPSSDHASVVLNVTSLVIISMPPFQPDRNDRNANWCSVISVTNPTTPVDRNTRAVTIAGPIEVLLTNLSPNATLENPSGTFTGSPFNGSPFKVLQPQSLPPGGQVNVGLCFLNPTGAPITFTPVIVSGAI